MDDAAKTGTDNMKVKNSVVLVTGANRGIGKGFVEALLKQGAKRIYAAARDVNSLASLVALAPEKIVPLVLDITEPTQIEAAAAVADDVTLLINNAGALTFGSLLDAPIENVTHELTTNYLGTLRVIRAFVPGIERQGGGAIVNVMSVVALANIAGIGGYSASKAAEFSMTQAIRKDLADRSISVHGVFPGPVDTDMARDFPVDKASVSDVVAAVLVGIERGDEDIFPDAMSQGAYETWKHAPKDLEVAFRAL